MATPTHLQKKKKKIQRRRVTWRTEWSQLSRNCVLRESYTVHYGCLQTLCARSAQFYVRSKVTKPTRFEKSAAEPDYVSLNKNIKKKARGLNNHVFNASGVQRRGNTRLSFVLHKHARHFLVWEILLGTKSHKTKILQIPSMFLSLLLSLVPLKFFHLFCSVCMW
jgi:hypothetical protein